MNTILVFLFKHYLYLQKTQPLYTKNMKFKKQNQ